MFRFIPVVLLLFSASPARACPVCLEALGGENPRLVALLERIEKSGEASIPELRALAADPGAETDLRTVATRHLGYFGDRESLSHFREIVLEILNPDSELTFGQGSPTSVLRDAAAEALGVMDEVDVADLVWAGWDELSPSRRIEVPRLLGQLRDPRAQQRQVEILRAADCDALALMVIVELRRTGTSSAVPAIEERREVWIRRAAGTEDLHHRRDFNRLARYAEGTIRALRSR